MITALITAACKFILDLQHAKSTEHVQAAIKKMRLALDLATNSGSAGAQKKE